MTAMAAGAAERRLAALLVGVGVVAAVVAVEELPVLLGRGAAVVGAGAAVVVAAVGGPPVGTAPSPLTMK